MRSLAFWLLLPFLFPQAMIVRRGAPRFEPPGGPTAGSFGKGREVRIAAIGDSIVAGVGAKALEGALVGRTACELARRIGGHVSWVAIGRIGASSRDVLETLVPLLPELEQHLFVVSVGVNDITSLSLVSSWERNLDELLVELEQHSPHAMTVVTGIPPLESFPLLPTPLGSLLGMRARTFNAASERVIARHRRALFAPVSFVARPEKFAGDGFHPSEIGYSELGTMLAERVLTSISGSPDEAEASRTLQPVAGG